MSCYHPLLAIYIGRDLNPGWNGFLHFDKKFNTKKLLFIDNTSENREKYPNAIEIPCGKCVGCRLDYSRRWANRCMMEAQYHKNNYFLTLTYSDLNLPIGKYGNATLDTEAISKFMKKLRKKFGSNIKFFGCGEYGETTLRPHYHLLAFGLDLQDLSEFFPYEKDGKILKITKKGKTGEKMFYSQELEKIWSLGNVVVGSLTWDSCAYVARYVMKKQNSNSDVLYQKLGIEPEFVRMSRRPGIGYQFFQDHKEKILQTREVFLPGKDGAIKAGIPQYFKKQLMADELDNGVLDEALESDRQIKLSKIRLDSSKLVDYTIDEERRIQEDSRKEKIRILKRD